MNKKLFTLLLALVAIATTAGAQTKYDIWVGGVQVTSANASNITGGDIKSGTVTFKQSTNGVSTLTLKNVRIVRSGSSNRGIRNQIDGLKIVFEGTNTITTSNSCALRCDANTVLILEENSKTTFTEGTQEAFYLTKGSKVIIQGTSSGELVVKSTSEYAVEGTGTETVSFQGRPNVTFNGVKGCLVNLKEVLFYGTSTVSYKNNVTLKATNNTSYPQVQNVAEWKEFGYNHIDAPVYKANHPKFSTSSKTILKPSGLSGNLTSYDIVINEDVLQLNSTHIPDANLLAYVKTLYTQNENGYPNRGFYSKAMAKEVAKINVNNKNISKLDGIEYFTGITDLDCANNQLTSLNVSGCNALTDLQCYNNQLSSLNVNGCTALIQLSCNNNQLSSLSVSGCTALTKLYCYNNQLSSLNVSGCNALTLLYCYNNQLSSLNVSGCNALTLLYCNNNQLSSLNVSGCTALKKLSCSDNQLTSLNLLNRSALEELYCNNNQLKSLDVSNNTALITLWCYGNKINKTNMQTLVNSLPKVSGGKFYVINTKDSNEGNVITKSQVAIAKGKGWKVADPYGNEYAGSDDTPTSIDNSQFTIDNSDDAWYSLDGKKLRGEPTKKGVYIRNGRKVIK